MQGEPRGANENQGEPGGAKGKPGGARGSKGEPRGAKGIQEEPQGAKENQEGPRRTKWSKTLLRKSNLWTDPKVVWKTRKTRKRMVTATPKKITVTVAPSLPTDKV